MPFGEGSVSTRVYQCPDCGRLINQRDRKAKRMHGNGDISKWNKPCGRKKK